MVERFGKGKQSMVLRCMWETLFGAIDDFLSGYCVAFGRSPESLTDCIYVHPRIQNCQLHRLAFPIGYVCTFTILRIL